MAVLLAMWLTFAWHKGWSARSAASERMRIGMVRGGCLLIGAAVYAIRRAVIFDRIGVPFLPGLLVVAALLFAGSSLARWIFDVRKLTLEGASRDDDADEALLMAAFAWLLCPALLQSWVEVSGNFSLLFGYRNPGWTVAAGMAVAGYVGAAVAAGCAGQVRLRRLRRLTAMTRGADPEWEVVPGAAYSAGSALLVPKDGPRDGATPSRWTAFRPVAESSRYDGYRAAGAQLFFVSDRADWLVRKRFYRARILMLACVVLAIAQADCSSKW